MVFSLRALKSGYLERRKDVDNLPVLKFWQLYFEKADGYENRQKIVTRFAKFWKDRREIELDVPGKCKLGGYISGHPDFRDGDNYFTVADVKTIKRVDRECICGIPHDLMVATTTTGEKISFYSDDDNVYMFMMLSDLIHGRGLNESPFHYLAPTQRGKNFI